jgi:hypothetical protein
MKLAQVRQPTASKNQFRPVNFHDFCYTILTKILNILDSNLCIRILNSKTDIGLQKYIV